ncbi:MAG TPA: molybdopterin-dependent oxidoreductase [Actinomycetota bacterium]|nr:molybdopterin-dependent oxidoreductase [Actinomycetota bacterium]
MSPLSRRTFLKVAGGTAVGVASLGQAGMALRRLAAVSVANPLEDYPSRDWEDVYRDQYRYDSSFPYVCSPNDTHACRMRAFVRNGVVLRIEQNYDAGRIQDALGNSTTPAWNPRGCPKGMTMQRRIYGPYRLRYPMLRAGWREWADDGFPYLTPALRDRYRFTSRGTDRLVRTEWDEVYRYMAGAIVATAEHYSGEAGSRRLLDEGYVPEMVESLHEAGTRTIKMRGGMGLLGVLGKYGMYRFNNMLALLDGQIRDVPPEETYGGRNWSNYTWHGDQAPGFPFVHGLQNAEVDFNDLRNSVLHVQVGKNLVENKMADSHWFHEIMERGGRIVAITPEYSPPASKADYWIPVRPQTDAALFLGITRLMIDRGWYDPGFVKRYTDLPILVRTDTLARLDPADVIEGYEKGLRSDGASFAEQGMLPEDYERLHDFVVWDGGPVPITRDEVGNHLSADPDLGGRHTIRLLDGSRVEVAPLFELYRQHLRDYDLDTVTEITSAPRELIERLAEDFWMLSPAAIHVGEGINHWFHATEANRAFHLPLMLTGNFGKPGAGCYAWAGNYKSALFQETEWSGPGFNGWIYEDPFAQNLDVSAKPKEISVFKHAKGEEPAYWNHGDVPLVVETPKYGRKVFTGETHMPTPTKILWFTNVNLLNNAKHAYDMLFNVNPKIDMIVSQDIEMTSSCEYADVVLAANSWLEFEDLEVTASCSNPFLQVWKGGIKPVYDTKDDMAIMAGVAAALAEETGDERFRDHWKFEFEGKRDVYLKRLLGGSATTADYDYDTLMAGGYGEPGVALMMFRTYPRIPFYEQIHDQVPFFTDTGRLNAYCDIPEAIEYGENFIVHREGPEATPYLPNVIVSTNPLIRPEDYGIPLDAMGWDERTVRNVKMAWEDVKGTSNPLVEQGFRFYLMTPKQRHSTHSQWAVTDWHFLWSSDFSDPYRTDTRQAGVAEHQMHMNPEAAKDLGLHEGDYVHVDANPADRPYRGWKPDDWFFKVARLMVRVKFNPAYPYDVVMIKHAPFISTEKTVLAHESRPDGRAVSEDTGYQASFRYGSHQSLTRDWSMPMHQTDSLFHKSKDSQHFVFGYEPDNHAVNTVPKETLVRVEFAEAGGLGGQGEWKPGTTGRSPGSETPEMVDYLLGRYVRRVGR